MRPVEHWMPPGARGMIGRTAHLRHQRAVSSIEPPQPIKAAEPPKSCNRKCPCLRLRDGPVSARQRPAPGARPANHQHLQPPGSQGPAVQVASTGGWAGLVGGGGHLPSAELQPSRRCGACDWRSFTASSGSNPWLVASWAGFDAATSGRRAINYSGGGNGDGISPPCAESALALHYASETLPALNCDASRSGFCQIRIAVTDPLPYGRRAQNPNPKPPKRNQPRTQRTQRTHCDESNATPGPKPPRSTQATHIRPARETPTPPFSPLPLQSRHANPSPPRSSNSGGTSSKGSGVQPTYGGGRYYPGGAAVPYRAGSKSALGIVPFLLLGSAIAFWPGVWLYGAYMYHYPNPYRYYNETSKANETREVICGCARFSVCGCDNNNDTAYYDELIGNGSYAALNKSIVNVARVNGTTTILINGTLANGTTVADEDADSEDSAAGSSMQALAEALGFWPVVAAVMATVFMA
ncbi:hypothetical protein G7Z17_g10960 [Cylindrodendrum hubeiense]|uniref:DUF7732 domain-containing protein n=1 Tax=Cylindrodendrum hubeiense TaxID=595255 RepID=A0A9P5L4C7_9HYPO|nr:hypothetical protein G7Z17_g10960 [Cylindrodendrum hubeiense]